MLAATSMAARQIISDVHFVSLLVPSSSLTNFISPRAADLAYCPPLPIATIPSSDPELLSGVSTLPLPSISNVSFISATIMDASRRRSILSPRHSFASSTDARRSCDGNSLSFASSFSKSVIASAVEPAKPTSTVPGSLYLLTFGSAVLSGSVAVSDPARRSFRALSFAMTLCPKVTRLSPIITTSFPLRMQRMVVVRSCSLSALGTRGGRLLTPR
mmetsp:Transcript_33655/g.52616  ORF Transcript_33655/g.52616 Transcript_33655/m.52616 type:complete len:216 (+) Transcript_33655:270-917(+)